MTVYDCRLVAAFASEFLYPRVGREWLTVWLHQLVNTCSNIRTWMNDLHRPAAAVDAVGDHGDSRLG